MPARPGSWLVLATITATFAGCGEGLLGEDGLSELTGFDEFDAPTSPAWMVRWMLEGDVHDGPPQSVETEQVYMRYEAEEEDAWYEYMDYLEVIAPAIDTPPEEAIRHVGEYSFAVGVPMLLDDLDGDGVHRAPSGDEYDELWGVSTESVLLYVDGSLDQIASVQPIGMEILSDECECILEIEQGLNYTMVEFDVLNLWWELEELQQEEDGWDDGELRVLWPDHPNVQNSDHEGAFTVEGAGRVEDWFHGGVESFLGPAWWTWFHDEPGEGGEER